MHVRLPISTFLQMELLDFEAPQLHCLLVVWKSTGMELGELSVMIFLDDLMPMWRVVS